MANYTRNDLTGLLAPVNSELEKIEQAIEDKLDRKPSSGQANELKKDLDANGHRIYNLPAPESPNDAARLKDVQDAVDTEIDYPDQTGLGGHMLSTDGANVYWKDPEDLPISSDTQDALDDKVDTSDSYLIFSTTEDIEDSLPTVEGQRAENVERVSAQYVLAPEGYIALPGDVVAANGRVWELQIDGKANVLWFGAVADWDGSTGTDNYDAFMDAKERSSHVFVPDGRYRTSRGLRMDKANFTLEMESPETEIACTGDAAGFQRFPEYSALLLGTYITLNINNAESYDLNSVSLGSDSVALSTSGDAVNFSIGDLVLINSSDIYGISADPVLGPRPTWGQLTRVVDISGGSLYLEDRVEESGGATIKNMSDNNYNYHFSDAVDSGTPNFCADNVEVIGGTFTTLKDGAAFSSGGGMYKCKIHPHTVNCRNGVAYGNLFAYCDLSSVNEIVKWRSAEMAYCSHGNTVNIASQTKLSGYAVQSGGSVIQVNESARNNVIRIGNVNAGDNEFDYGVSCISSKGNTITVNSFQSNGTGQIAYISDPTYTGDRIVTENNTIDIKSVKSENGTRLGRFSCNGNCVNNTISVSGDMTPSDGFNLYFSGSGYESNQFERCKINEGSILLSGSYFGGRIINCYIADGIPSSYYGQLYVSGTQSNASKLMELVRKREGTEGATTSQYSKASTIKAGAFQKDDKIEVKSFIKANAVGGAEIKMNFDGSNVFTHPTDTGAFDCEVNIEIVTTGGSSGILFLVKIVENNSVVLQGEYVSTGLDLDSNDYDFEFIVDPVASGPVSIRSYDVKKTSSDILE